MKRPATPAAWIAMNLGTLLFVLVLLALVLALGLHARHAQAMSRPPAASGPLPGDLHGLAQLKLPRGFISRGLEGADRDLSPAEQLERHDEREPLVFRLARDPQNDSGGNARDPELLNAVLQPAGRDAAAAWRGYSIQRYYSPTGDTIPLSSPRWKEGGDARYRWRVLAMDDHFSADHEARWAITLLDPTRGVRLDYFVWRSRATQDQALALLRELMDGLQTTPALANYFMPRGMTPEQRMTALREARVAGVFAALAPQGLQAVPPGATRFAPGVAAWLDSDGQALRVQRMLASAPLPGGAASVARDRDGRPQLPLAQAPVRAPQLGMLYWSPTLQRWQLSRLQERTGHEADPLLPFHQAIVQRLEMRPGARDAVHLVVDGFWYQPPVLDDAREAVELLRLADRWQADLLAGRLLGGSVITAMLR